MNLWRSLVGMLRVELTGADIGSTIRNAGCQGILMEELKHVDEFTVNFSISRTDYKFLEDLAGRRGDKLSVLKREGLFWSLEQLRHRPVLMVGIALLLTLVLLVPTRILFVSVEGNVHIPTRQILDAASNSGIHFGVSRRQVRSEKIKNRLLAELPELQWMGVNTRGCVAEISVRERSIPEASEDSKGISNIVAARDGVILSCTAVRGNLLCAPGQAVKSGDVLISGLTDCGLKVTATRAEGEVYAKSRRTITAVTPANRQIRGALKSETIKYSLIIGKKRINFYKGSGIWDATCGKMYTQYYLTLPGGFPLPVSLVRETYSAYELSQGLLEHEDAQQQLTDFADDYLRGMMIAGTIEHSDSVIVSEEGVFSLTGEFSCTEMIGAVRYEKIGEYNGKTDGTDR